MEDQCTDIIQLPLTISPRSDLKYIDPATQGFHHIFTKPELCNPFIDVRKRIMARHDLAHGLRNPGNPERKCLVSGEAKWVRTGAGRHPNERAVP